jgi:beta-1,4-mannosyl-glycoprotein beta-1,4-N-acetylglucosaminyltransferase
VIIDACMVFNEIDVLELRLHELDPVVDKFVIVEALETFGSTEKKPAVLQENWEVVKPFEHKIDYTILTKLQPPFTDSATGWQREKFQRDAMMPGIESVATSDNDIVIVSDADEIPRASVVQAAANLTETHRLNLDFYYYNVNCLVGKWPWGTTIGPLKEYRRIGGVHQARSNGYHDTNRVIDNAGWHFSYFGGVDRIKKKVASFSHASDDFCQAFLNRSDEEAAKDIAARQDIYRTRGLNQFEHKASNDPALPAYFLQNPERFKHFTEEYGNGLHRLR